MKYHYYINPQWSNSIWRTLDGIKWYVYCLSNEYPEWGEMDEIERYFRAHMWPISEEEAFAEIL